MKPSPAVERRIRTRAAELEQFYDAITGCDVIVEAPHRHGLKGRLYSVRLSIHVPKGTLAVSRGRRHHHAHEDIYVALRDAFDAGARRLEDYARRRRGDVKRHEQPARATRRALAGVAATSPAS
jgi:ribosome-associated translation inhibitor RaiA